MTRRVARAARLFLLLQWRFRFVHVYLLLALLTVLGFRWALPPAWREWLLPAFLLGEPGSLGLALVAAHLFLERSERSATALAVTPLRSAEHVLALALASTLVAALAGALVQAGVLGLDARLAALLAPLLLTASLSGFLGLALAAYFDEFTRFLVAAFMPAMTLLSLPYLAYFELVPRAAFVWLPTDAALFALAGAVRGEGGLLIPTLLLAAWNVLAFRWAHHAFEARVRGGLEQA